MDAIDQYGKNISERALAVRTRTWTLTIAILVSLAFYLVVNVTTQQKLDIVTFVLLTIMQILVHSMYFPDGDLFGQKDKRYVSNRTAYNVKADEINEKREIGQLRKYCDWEYEERKKRYIHTQLGYIGITEEEFASFKLKSETQIMRTELWEFGDNGNEYDIRLSKQKRKMLCHLIYKPIPVRRNHPETIMSATENDGSKEIRDTSIAYKIKSYCRKVATAILIGGIFAYIGYSVKDGFGLAQIVQIIMYLSTLFSTAVMAFTSGETCSKVHKANFYKDLVNFIDGFNEWNMKKGE